VAAFVLKVALARISLRILENPVIEWGAAFAINAFPM
jgi:peptidoglycan/LPS O-acetylase OafA/YrhL